MQDVPFNQLLLLMMMIVATDTVIVVFIISPSSSTLLRHPHPAQLQRLLLSATGYQITPNENRQSHIPRPSVALRDAHAVGDDEADAMTVSIDAQRTPSRVESSQ